MGIVGYFFRTLGAAVGLRADQDEEITVADEAGKEKTHFWRNFGRVTGITCLRNSLRNTCRGLAGEGYVAENDGFDYRTSDNYFEPESSGLVAAATSAANSNSGFGTNVPSREERRRAYGGLANYMVGQAHKPFE